jgi:hypothetical protein
MPVGLIKVKVYENVQSCFDYPWPSNQIPDKINTLYSVLPCVVILARIYKSAAPLIRSC